MREGIVGGYCGRGGMLAVDGVEIDEFILMTTHMSCGL
jgi:hypothetical protein